MKKLSMGRINAFVVEEKSGLTAMEQTAVKNVEYNKDKVLSEMDVFYAFQKTPEGDQLAKKFSKALEDMRKDGTFQKIMSKAK
jgi:polar amino acid transport system substrate-binding protein